MRKVVLVMTALSEFAIRIAVEINLCVSSNFVRFGFAGLNPEFLFMHLLNITVCPQDLFIDFQVLCLSIGPV